MLAAVAVTVQVDPSVQVCPFTVVDGLTRSALVTNPVAVNEPVTVSAGIVRPLGSVVTEFNCPVVMSLVTTPATVKAGIRTLPPPNAPEAVSIGLPLPLSRLTMPVVPRNGLMIALPP